MKLYLIKNFKPFPVPFEEARKTYRCPFCKYVTYGGQYKYIKKNGDIGIVKDQDVLVYNLKCFPNFVRCKIDFPGKLADDVNSYGDSLMSYDDILIDSKTLQDIMDSWIAKKLGSARDEAAITRCIDKFVQALSRNNVVGPLCDRCKKTIKSKLSRVNSGYIVLMALKNMGRDEAGHFKYLGTPGMPDVRFK